MPKREGFDLMLVKTKNITLLWKESRGFCSDAVADKLDEAMLDWLYDLTSTLKIWIEKGENMTDGELILARVNLGSVMESWFRLFYTIYLNEYNKNPHKNNKGKAQSLENLNFVDLQEFSTDKLWEDTTSDLYKWVDSARKKRNAIHAFNKKDIGTSQDFLQDINMLCLFVDKIESQLPKLEDNIDSFPAGYDPNPYFYN